MRRINPSASFVTVGLVAISAGIVRGRRATGSLGIKDDLVNAGATWVDAPAFRDGNQVWVRVVADIPISAVNWWRIAGGDKDTVNKTYPSKLRNIKSNTLKRRFDFYLTSLRLSVQAGSSPRFRRLSTDKEKYLPIP